MTTAQTSGTSLRRFKTYPAYKDTGVDWLGEAPEHWEVLKSTWLFSIGSGTTPAADVGAYYAGEVPWVTTSELRESVISRTEKSVTAQALRDYPALRLYPRGSLAVAMYGATIGRLGMLGIDATVNQACCVFSRPKGISVAFWYYWMLMRRPYLTSLGLGGGQPNLSQDLLRSIRAPIPPIDEQRAIAAFLDRETVKIDLLVAQKERLIALPQEQRTALITRAVTRGLDPNAPMKDSGVQWLGEIPAHWESKRVKSVTGEHKQGFYTEQAYVDEGVRLARITDIDDYANVSFGDMPFVQIPEKAEVEFRIVEGDFLFARSGTIGRFGIVRQNERAVFASYLIRFRFKGMNPEFLRYAFQSRFFREGLMSSLHGGANQNVHAENIKEQWVPVPPLGEQASIAGFLDAETAKQDILVGTVSGAMARMQELRAALISAAVTGKIDVREEVA